MALLGAIHPQATRGLSAPGLWRWMPLGLAAAAAVELVLLRIVTRTAVQIPGIDQAHGPYLVIAETGRFAYALATLLLVTVVVALAIALLRVRTAASWCSLGGLAAFAIAATGARAGLVGDQTLALVSLASVAALAPWAARRAGPRAGASLALFAAAFALAGAFAVSQSHGSPALFRDSSLLLTSEALALLFALSAPLLAARRLERRLDRRSLLIAALAGLAVLGALLGSPSNAMALGLWSFGLAGYFPAVVYAAAAAAVTYAILASLPAQRTTAIGLTLLVLGGIGLQSTYQTGLVVAGFAVLGEWRAPGGVVRPRAA